MYSNIFNILASRGFFEESGMMTKYKGAVKYCVFEKDKTLVISRVMADDDAAEDMVLEQISSMAGRFGITDAVISRGKLEVRLSPPGINYEEEARRIDYAIESMDSAFYSYGAKTGESDGPGAGAAQSTPVEDPGASSSAAGDVRDPGPMANDSSEDAAMGGGYRPDGEGSAWQGSLPREDSGFSPLGLIGAVGGALAGALLIGGLSVLGFYVSFLGFITAILIINGYQLLSGGRRIPVPAAGILILLSVFLGNVLSIAVDIYRYYGTGIAESLRLGFQAHFDNQNFNIGQVWLSFALSLVFAGLGAYSVLKNHRTGSRY